MKIVKVVTAACRCTEKLEALRSTNRSAGLAPWVSGTIVQCDCEVHYTLSDSQRDGFFWRKSTLREIGYANAQDRVSSETWVP